MADSGHPVGPFPEGADAEDYDRMRRRVLWAMPSGLYVLGSRAGDRRNLMTLSWAAQLSFDPKLVGVSVEASAVTYELIVEGGAFSVCLLAREDRALVRKLVKPSVHDPAQGTLNGVAFRDGLTGVPVVSAAAGHLDCEVRHRLDLGDHSLFVGEVVDAGFSRPEGTEVLRMEDTRMSYGG